MSPQYSHISCRHGPHGVPASPLCVTTTIASTPRSPAASAEGTATPPPQTVSPYVQFSPLHPRKTLPALVRRAAPTLNLEKGATAFSRALIASSISVLSIMGRGTLTQ